MKKGIIITLCVWSIIFLVVPSGTFAQESSFVVCTGQQCQACDLMKLANKVISFLIMISATIAALLFMYAGFLYVTAQGSMEKIRKATATFTNVAIGFMLMLSAFLIVNTVMQVLVGDNLLGRGAWYKIDCEKDIPLPGMGGAGSEAVPGGTSPVTVSGEKLSDRDARNLLTAAGIAVNKTMAEGTSLEDINAATIRDAINLKAACGCDIVITGGTESTGGHSAGNMSHGAGYKYDVRLNSTLDSYITTNYKPAGVRSDGAQMYISPTGNVYAREGNHWDIQVKSK